MQNNNTSPIRFDTSAGRAVLFKALEHGPAAIALTDRNGTIVYVNERFSQVTGYEPAEIIGQHSRTMKSGEQSPAFYQRLWDTVLSGSEWSGDFHNRKKNGELYWERATISPIRNDKGDIEFFVKISEEITAQRELEKALRMSEERHRTLIENIPGVIYRCRGDRNWTMLFLSPDIISLSGYPASDFLHNRVRTFASIIHPDDRAIVEETMANVTGKQSHFNLEYRIVNADGNVHWVHDNGEAVYDARGVLQWLDGVMLDITDRKRLEHERDQLMKQLREKTLRDPLTGLLNRRGFDQEFRRIWSMSLRHPFPIGLLIIDIDHFKTLNDSYGHPVGDQILMECARMIEESVRESDIVCRYGGDEMIVILPWSDGDETRAAGERMVESFRQRELCRETHHLRVTISVGAGSVIPSEDSSADRYLSETDKALYRAKRAGRNRICMIEQAFSQEGAPPATGAKEPVRIADGTETKTVLVVDDDPLFRDLIGRQLADTDFRLFTTDAATRAMEIAEQHRGQVDVALVDLRLGHESGLDLIKKFREIDDTLITIIVTGRATITNAIEALRVGAYDFVQKPVTPSRLMVALERALRYRRLVQENQRYQMHLENMVREKSMALTQALNQVRASFQFTLEAMAAMLDARERKTGDHSKRVAMMSRVLAREMGLEPDDIQTVETGALLHDIGKIAIPDAILLKPGPLTDKEREIMSRHPRLGYDMIRGIPELKEAAEIVHAHQEFYDGKGYPRGLKGEEICAGARIFSVADAYDAIRSDRPYSKSKSAQVAMDEILRQKGRQFDPEVVDALIRCRDEIENVGNWPETV